ncbi:MAG TPA: DsrE family protein [Actinomycetota bacterium]|nr:DsrE family protein [Actinomycetota bacterium]
MRFVYTISRGASDPTGMSIPLHMAANGSLEVGHEVTVLFVGDGTDVFVGDNADRIEGVGVPPMPELLAKLKDRGATVFV